MYSCTLVFILVKLIMFNSHTKMANMGKYERFCGYIDGSVFIIFQIGFKISRWRGACLCRNWMDRGHPSVCGGNCTNLLTLTITISTFTYYP